MGHQAPSKVLASLPYILRSPAIDETLAAVIEHPFDSYSGGES
jgi:hypothetical protein